MTKYQRWHDQLIQRACTRKPPAGYTESHHVTPRSLGGLDSEANLVDLTYREHFLVHWLLTKITAAGALRKMQRAMMAMTITPSEPARDVCDDLRMDHVDNGLPCDVAYSAPESDPA